VRLRESGAERKTLQPVETATLNVSMDAASHRLQDRARVRHRSAQVHFHLDFDRVRQRPRRRRVSLRRHRFRNLQRGQTPIKPIDIDTRRAPTGASPRIVKSSAAPFEFEGRGLPPGQQRPTQGLSHSRHDEGRSAGRLVSARSHLKTNDPACPRVEFNIVGNVQTGLDRFASPIVVRDLKVGESAKRKGLPARLATLQGCRVDGQGDGVTVDIPNRHDTTLVLTSTSRPTESGRPADASS